MLLRETSLAQSISRQFTNVNTQSAVGKERLVFTVRRKTIQKKELGLKILDIYLNEILSCASSMDPNVFIDLI